MTGSVEPHPSDLPPTRMSILAGTSALAAANLLVAAASFVSGPLQARALGPAGRGELAAIVAPLAMVAFITTFGQPEYATREVARGRSMARVIGSVYPSVFLLSTIGGVALWLLAPELADGRDAVTHYLRIGSVLLPAGALTALMTGAAAGASRFGLVGLAQVSGAVSYSLTVGVLYLLGELTLRTAAVAFIATGTLPLLLFLIALRPGAPRFSREIQRAGFGFGSRAWLGAVAITLNSVLDQVLMAGLTTSRQLGLYVVAVTFSALPRMFVSPLASAILPRVSGGDSAVVARACRVSIAASLLAGLGLAGAAYFAIPLLFGSDFSDAYQMTVVMLFAQVLSLTSGLLGYSLRTGGRPGVVSVAEVAALVVTVPGIILVVPDAGGLGAAAVSLLAGLPSCGLLIWASRRHFGGSVQDYLRLRRSDVADIRAVATGGLSRLRRPARR